MDTRFRTSQSRAGVLLLVLAAACGERGGPLAPVEPAPPEPVGLARIECRVNVPNRRLTCGETVSTDARALVLGGTFAKLASSNVAYDDSIFSFDLTVQNLTIQPIGTRDGVTPDSTGVRVFLEKPPVVTAGTGTISVPNSDGQAEFTAPNQHYYTYADTLLGPNGILAVNDTTRPRKWEFHMPPTVQDFSIVFNVDAAVCPGPLGLAVGGAANLPMPASASFCLGGGASGAEYVVIPVNTGLGDRPMRVTATGIVPVFGQPNPNLVPGTAFPAFRASTPRADDSFEWRLRERERRELAGLVPPGRRSTAAARPRWNLVPGTPVVGDLMQLNVRVSTLCSNADVRTARVKAVGSHVVVLSDTTNPANGFTSTDFQDIADLFDDLVWPTLTGAFGEPGDEDGNGRIAVFFTRAVNELTPSGGAYNAGFFLSRDLYSTASCPTSNVGEMIYMAAPDPSGAVNGNARSVAFVKYHAARTMGHELQHLRNASYRLLYTSGRLEEVWLDEGLSGIAEELLFYAASGKTPKQNLGVTEVADGGAVQEAFFAYAEPNLARLRPWLQAPHAGGPADLPASSGTTWALLRYLADWTSDEAAFWRALITSDTTGTLNIRQALGGIDVLLRIHNVGVAMYADDALPGVTPGFTQSSWNFRSLYGAFDYDGDGFADAYPLATRNPSSGVAESFTLSGGGGAAYLRMGVSADGLARVSITSTNGAALPLVVRTVVIRRK